MVRCSRLERNEETYSPTPQTQSPKHATQKVNTAWGFKAHLLFFARAFCLGPLILLVTELLEDMYQNPQPWILNQIRTRDTPKVYTQQAKDHPHAKHRVVKSPRLSLTCSSSHARLAWAHWSFGYESW